MKKVLLSLLVALTLSGVSAASEPEPGDFAYGVYLEVSGEYPVYKTPVPLPVYQGLTRADLGDLCVFNAQGEMVPFMLRTPEFQSEAEPEVAALPLFPVMGAPGMEVGGVSMQVVRDDKGSIINVTTDGRVPEAGQTLVAYLIDADALKEPIVKFELDAGTMPEGGMARLNVEFSNDLRNWYSLVRGATIAELHYGGHSLEVRDIELGNTSAKYFRLSPYDNNRMVELAGVRAILAGKAVERDRTWHTVKAVRSADAGDEYLFDTTGRIPVDRLRVRLPQRNTLIEAQFMSSGDGEGPWRMHAKTLVYGLQVDGTYLNSPDVSFAPTTDRQWLMKVMPGSGGIGEGEPYVEAGWIPHDLVFVARGAAPFILAYGSGRISPNSGGSGYLIAKLDELDGRNRATGRAEVGEVTTLGGQAALQAEKPPLNLKKLVLWAILISGVAILAFMALKLYRQMSAVGGQDE